MDNHPIAPKKKSNERWRNEPTLPKQRVLLEFLKQPVPGSRGDASDRIAAIFESPGGNAHQKAWNVAKYKMWPDLYSSKTKNKNKHRASGTALGLMLKSVLVFVLKLTAVIAGLLYAWHRFMPASFTSVTGGETVLTMSAPNPKNSANLPVGDLISLKSTDGRMIRAKVLSLTKEKALIRREDGQTFILPLDRLTAESKKRIEEFQDAK